MSPPFISFYSHSAIATSAPRGSLCLWGYPSILSRRHLAVLLMEHTCGAPCGSSAYYFICEFIATRTQSGGCKRVLMMDLENSFFCWNMIPLFAPRLSQAAMAAADQSFTNNIPSTLRSSTGINSSSNRESPQRRVNKTSAGDATDIGYNANNVIGDRLVGECSLFLVEVASGRAPHFEEWVPLDTEGELRLSLDYDSVGPLPVPGDSVRTLK